MKRAKTLIKKPAANLEISISPEETFSSELKTYSKENSDSDESIPVPDIIRMNKIKARLI